MAYNLKLVGLLAVAFVAVMMLPAGAAASVNASVATSSMTLAPATVGHAPAASAAVSAATESGAATTESQVLAKVQSAHLAQSQVFLPNFDPKYTTAGGTITPLYDNAPAPMGLGDFGIRDVNGTNVGTISYTQSVKAMVNLNSVTPIYVTSSAPDIFTMQLNTVLTGTTLFGSPTYQFWIQNVPIYTVSDHTLSFEDNIWNFSSPAVAISANAIYSHGPYGFVIPGLAYISGGPSFHIPEPFTVYVYNNASVVNDRPTVYFNYTVVPSTGPAFSGSYDQVEFNSSIGTPTGPAATPSFQINGKAANPTGFLLNDAEIMLGGPGGGSTTTLFHISGSMGLWTLPNGTSTYQTVPAAYDFGTDTGETSEGIAEYATTGANPIAELNSGPSILYPLWGIAGATPGFETVTIDLTPVNAFVFANQGSSFDATLAGWAPTPTSNPVTYYLAPGTYTFKFLLSEYTPALRTVTGSTSLTVTMKSNPSLGVYTPLWAQSNSELAAISNPGGNGTWSNPYVLFNFPGTISPVFGQVNDYLFPVFPGIYLIDTTAYVAVEDAPSFAITYVQAMDGDRVAEFGAPGSNQLNVELYGAEHVAIVNSPELSGWFYNAASFGDPAAIYLWNSSWNLIGGNTIYVESNGITTSGGGHNTIWGNVFYPTTVPAANPSAVLNAGNTVALNEFESNDLIYNNAFLTPQTASTPPVNFYTGAPASYTDRWNVSRQPATDVRVVDGWSLTGSILGLSYLGGNYWDNYGTASNPYGVLPYTNGGQITAGGDYIPLTTVTLYRVWITESGLASGTTWSATVNGYTQSGTAATMVFWESNGTYAWSVGPVTGYTVSPSAGAVLVNGSSQTVKVVYK